VLQDEALTTAQWSSAQPLTPTNGGCPVQYGSWETPYDWNAAAPTTPQRVTFNASNNTLGTGLQIDHIVPESNAWETGAADWPETWPTQGNQMLIDFTNDRGGPELLAVSSLTNNQKNNSPPEIWTPGITAGTNPGMTCAYVKMWIAVKWEWDLEVGTINDGSNPNEPNERIFLQNTLNGC
jgi:hypothetical protein